MRRFFLLLFLLVLLGTSWAQNPCEGFNANTLELSGIGITYFGDLSFDSATGRAELFNGVCVVPQADEDVVAWVLEADALLVTDLSGRPNLEASEVSLTLGDWVIDALKLNSSAAGFELEQVLLNSGDISGTADTASYDLQNGDLLLDIVSVKSSNYRINGATALLTANALLFEDAIATTCVCEGGELYVVSTPAAVFDLLSNNLLIRDGVLKIGGIDIALASELKLSEETLSDFSFPLSLSYDEDNGTTLQTIGLRLGEGVLLDAGVAGLDAGHDLNGIFLLRIRQDGVSATLGKALQGPQFDFRKVENLNSWLKAIFEIRNRNWAEQDFLHEGSLGLAAESKLDKLFFQDSLTLRAELTAAAASQIIDDTPVSGPRLVGLGELDYRLPNTPLGDFRLKNTGTLSYYPSADIWQYGLRLIPSWKASLGPLNTSISYDRRWTNSASPFSTKLDRLEPLSVLSAAADLEGVLATGVFGRAAVSARYDFLSDIDPERGAFETLQFQLSADVNLGDVTVSPLFELELAELLNSTLDDDVEAYALAGIDVSGDGWLLGVSGRYDLRETRQLDLLELRTRFPINISEVSLNPFIALDFADLVTVSGPVELSGYGLDLQWRSCCGTLNFAYQQYREDLRASVSFELGGR